MKKILLFSLLALFVGTVSVSAQKKKAAREFRYEIVSMGTGSQGSALIKVYSYAKKEINNLTGTVILFITPTPNSHQQMKRLTNLFLT